MARLILTPTAFTLRSVCTRPVVALNNSATAGLFALREARTRTHHLGCQERVCIPARERVSLTKRSRRYEWRDNLSNRIDESCGIEVSFGADNDLLVVTLQPEDDDY